MQIYFGAVPTSEVFDSDAMFVAEGDNDNMYYYGVEYGSNTGGFDEVMIYDGLDREVPVDMDSVPALIYALQMALKASNLQQAVVAVADQDLTVGIAPTKE
jgi:hypothetical protein